MAAEESVQAQLIGAADLPELLSASHDAFELIRVLARRCEDQAPELFAAFLTTADAAVDGREAITNAPSLPAVTANPLLSGDVMAHLPADQVISTVGELGAILAERLTRGARVAIAPGDAAACEHAAAAARQIRDLMGGATP